MSVHVEGSVQAPVATIVHVEPHGPIEVGVLPAGSSKHIMIGDYWNNSNIDQTLDLTVTNLVGCTFVSKSLTGDNGTEEVLPAIVSQGHKATFVVEVRADDRPFGAPDEEMSFDVESTWV
jgi:hypothetical protein